MLHIFPQNLQHFGVAIAGDGFKSGRPTNRRLRCQAKHITQFEKFIHGTDESSIVCTMQATIKSGFFDIF